MKLTNYPAPFVEAICVFEALRRLGFSADDIYFMTEGAVDGATWKKENAIVLKTQGREFIVTVGSAPGTRKDVEEQWVALAKRASAGDFHEGFDAIYEASHVGQNGALFVAALLRKGFTFTRPS